MYKRGFDPLCCSSTSLTFFYFLDDVLFFSFTSISPSYPYTTYMQHRKYKTMTSTSSSTSNLYPALNPDADQPPAQNHTGVRSTFGVDYSGNLSRSSLTQTHTSLISNENEAQPPSWPTDILPPNANHCLFVFCLLDRSHCDTLQHQYHNHNFCYSFQRHQQDVDSIPHNAHPNHKKSTRYYCHSAKATKEAGRSTDAVAKRTHPAIDLHLGLPGGHLFSLEGRDGVDQSFVGRCTDDCVNSG